MAQAQSRLAIARAMSDPRRAQQLLRQASHLLKQAAKKALKLAKTRHLSPVCAGALYGNLLEANSHLGQLRNTP